MRVSESREPQLRGSGETWLSAAYQSLVESGVDAVRIGPLAKKVKLSRTSFYWFFRP
jgi:AcrR family transcriptional regulator